MATTDSNGFANLVPGFDFLQGLMKNAGAALPNMGQWVAPTLDPAEIEKRIEELRTVQFWLEQNGRLLGTTIQALEVQRMTLSTLKTMNVQMGDLRESLKIRVPGAEPAASVPPTMSSWFSPPSAASPSASSAASGPADETAASPSASTRADPAASPQAVDPMQWWRALTEQFTQIATNAVQDGSAETAKSLAAKTLQQSFEAAGAAFRSAMPSGAAKPALTKPRAPRKAAKRASPKRSAARKPAAKR